MGSKTTNWIMTRSNKTAPAAVMAAPPASLPAPLPAAAEPKSPTKACPSFQRPVNDDWSHCPYCGTALVPGEQPHPVE